MNVDPSFTQSADGTQIAFYDFGGNGPDLLLGHATGFCAHIWQPVVEHLLRHFHCVGYDLRGHGNSASPGSKRESWDWALYAQDAAATIRAANLTKPFSVGHSSGAATALLLEELAPGTFSAIAGFEPVMFDAIPPTGPDESRELAVRARKRRSTFESKQAALENFSTKGPFKNLHPDALLAYIEHGFALTEDGWTLRCKPEDEAAIYVMASDHTGFVNLGSVECPVLVVRGEDSIAFDEHVMQQVARRVRNGEFVSMQHTGHFGALEEPELFAKLVLDSFQPVVSTHR